MAHLSESGAMFCNNWCRIKRLASRPWTANSLRYPASGPWHRRSRTIGDQRVDRELGLRGNVGQGAALVPSSGTSAHRRSGVDPWWVGPLSEVFNRRAVDHHSVEWQESPGNLTTVSGPELESSVSSGAPGPSSQSFVLSGLAGGWTEVRVLLDEARTRLAADEVTLLLLDSSGTMLIPVAWSGLDASARNGFRVPVGAGFAGKVAATDRPLALTQVTPETVLNPALHRRGIHSLLGVPLPGRLGVLGVVHVGSETARQFTDDDIATLAGFAARLSVEVLSRRSSEEHLAALALQRSLVPTTTPTIEGLDIAARYVPADGDLGGDWYDVFRLPDQRLGVVMGDVAGHGLAAAIVMGRLRSALRAYALEHHDPAEVLRLLDLKISYFEAGAFATVLYAIAEPPYQRFEISSAGHLPPYLVTPVTTPMPVDVPPDPPLGVRSPTGTWTRRTTIVDVPVGGSLCLFTDGLVERRPPSGEASVDQLAAGLHRLAIALRPGPAETACTNVLTELLGEDVTEDDVAVLVLRRA